MHRPSAIRTGIRYALHGAVSVLMAGLALLALPPNASSAADATSFDTKTLAHQTQRLLNDAGQFYLAWWIPQGLSRALMLDTPGIQPADSERMLRPCTTGKSIRPPARNFRSDMTTTPTQARNS
jgi:hypothetical protein